MARSTAHMTWLCTMLAMVACFGAGAQAGRSLLQSTCANPTLPDVNLTAYTGVWFQIGATALQKATVEVNSICITGRYSLIESGPDANAIRVRFDSYNTSSGAYSSLVGLAKVTGRALSIQFPGLPTAIDYRIISLKGDPTDKYTTAITYGCSSGGTQSINILSRTPTLEGGDTLAGLIAEIQSKGITLEPNNQIVSTPQDAITCGRNYN